MRQVAWGHALNKVWAKIGRGDSALGRALALAWALCALSLAWVTKELVWDDSAALRGHDAWSKLWDPFAIDPAAYWRPLGVFAMELPRLMGLSDAWSKAEGPLLWAVGVSGALAFIARALPHHTPPGARKATLLALAAGFGALSMSAEPQLWISSRFDALLCALAPWAAWRVEGLWLSARDASLSLSSPGSLALQRKTPPRLALRVFEGVLWALALALSKETGAAWVAGFVAWALARVFFGNFGADSSMPITERARRNASLLALAVGLGLGFVVWCLLRHGQLQHAANVTELMGRRAGLPWSARGALFAQGTTRSFLAFVAPWSDPGPLKAAWSAWPATAGAAQGVVAAAIWILALGGSALAAWRVRSRASAGVWLALGLGVALALFHALLAAFAEQSNGALLADRYLAPSALLCAPAIAWALSWASRGGKMATAGFMAPIASRAAVFTLVFVWAAGQFIAWEPSRQPWRNSLDLWGAAAQSASETKLARVNWALALNAAGRSEEAAATSERWIAEHEGPKLENCRLYSNAMQAEMTLGHMQKARGLALESASFASCDPGLATAAVYFLLQDDKTCPKALPLLKQTQIEGDGAPGSNDFWSFQSPRQRSDILARRAFAEARCGSMTTANAVMDDMGRMEPKWRAGSPLRASLIQQAQRGK